MCAYIQSGTPEWSSASLTSISNYIAGSGSCMTESVPADISYAGNGIGVNYLKLIATNSISINSSSGAVVLNANGFGYVEAGTNVVLKPTNANSLGFLVPEGGTLLMRLGDVANTCDPLFVQSSGSSLKTSGNYNIIPDDINVQIRPNPFNSSFELILNLKEDKKVQMAIYNAVGVKVKQKEAVNLSKGSNKILFDCSAFAQGIYLLEINFGDFRTVKKLIKM